MIPTLDRPLKKPMRRREPSAIAAGSRAFAYRSVWVIALEPDDVPDPLEASPERAVREVEPVPRVDEEPLVDDLDVEVAGLVDEQCHQVGREDVEGVALVATRAVQREVLVEVALEAERLAGGDRHRQVRVPAVVVLRRVEHELGELALEPDRQIPERHHLVGRERHPDRAARPRPVLPSADLAGDDADLEARRMRGESVRDGRSCRYSKIEPWNAGAGADGLVPPSIRRGEGGLVGQRRGVDLCDHPLIMGHRRGARESGV